MFVLMTKHVQLLVTPSDKDSLTKLMQGRGGVMYNASIINVLVPALYRRAATSRL